MGPQIHKYRWSRYRKSEKCKHLVSFSPSSKHYRRILLMSPDRRRRSLLQTMEPCIIAYIGFHEQTQRNCWCKDDGDEGWWACADEWSSYKSVSYISATEYETHFTINKKAQLSLTNPRDAKACQNCSNSTCLQRCRWQYWPIFMRLTAITSEIREIPRNLLKIQTYGVQGHPRSSILVSIESPCTPSY